MGDATDSVTVTVDESLMPPEVSVVTPVEGGMVAANDLEVTGSATPGATIEVFIDGESAGSTTADDEGNWSVTVTSVMPGERTVYAEASVDDLTTRSDEVVFTATDDDVVVDEFEGLVLTGGCQQAPGSPGEAPLGLFLFTSLGLVTLRRRRVR